MIMSFIHRVTIRNYKSIAACRVDLGALMFLVGQNGTGKSNFLDALRFVSDSLRNSQDHALRDRGTLKEVLRRSGGHPIISRFAATSRCPWAAVGITRSVSGPRVGASTRCSTRNV